MAKPISEKLAAKEREADQAASGGKKEIKGPGLNEIRADERKSRLFLEYLKSEGEDTLGAKFINGINPEDHADLAERRQGFLEILERSETVLRAINERSIQELCEAVPDMKDLADVVGVRAIREALRTELPLIAITDRDRFEAMSENILAAAELDKRHEAAEARAKAAFEEYNMSEDEIVAAFRGGDMYEVARQQWLDKSWYTRHFKTSVESIQAEIMRLAKGEGSNIKYFNDKIMADRQELGALLHASLTENKEVYESINKRFLGDPVQKEQDISMEEVRKRPSEKDLLPAWGEYEEEYWDDMQSGKITKEEVARNFGREQAKKQRNGKRGAFSYFKEIIFSSYIENMFKN